MTIDDIRKVIVQIPQLTDFGVGIFRTPGMSRQEAKVKFQREQEALLGQGDACAKICEWLADKPKIKSINRHRSSYGLKHLAEEEIGYITNGQFIAAAIHSGFKFQLEPSGGPNVSFNISEKALTSIKKAALV
jgi:hypothetical protein